MCGGDAYAVNRRYLEWGNWKLERRRPFAEPNYIKSKVRVKLYNMPFTYAYFIRNFSNSANSTEKPSFLMWRWREEKKRKGSPDV